MVRWTTKILWKIDELSEVLYDSAGFLDEGLRKELYRMLMEMRRKIIEHEAKLLEDREKRFKSKTH